MVIQGREEISGMPIVRESLALREALEYPNPTSVSGLQARVLQTCVHVPVPWEHDSNFL